MIHVTIWNEYVQESGQLPEEVLQSDHIPEEQKAGFRNFVEESSGKIKEVYPLGITGTIAK